MLALPQEYAGSTCEVKSMENDLLAVGRVIKIDREALELAAKQGERLPLLQYRRPVKLFIHNQKHGTRILVATAYLSTDNFLRVEEVRPMQDFERRGAFRVNTSVAGYLTVLMSDDEQATFDAALMMATPDKQDEMMAKASFEVRVMDISLTGLRLQSAIPLAIGSRYIIEFTLLDATLNMCVKVQRHIETPGGEIQYGGIFFDASERQTDILCKELFQLQRLEKNRRRNSAASI